MQPVKDQFNVSRRAFDVEDYIDIARRHKAWILGPAFFGLVVAVVVAFLWPNTYVSHAVIRVAPPRVPEKYVPANVQGEIAERMTSMAERILNRTTLTTIIETYKLYPKRVAREPMENVIEDMRRRDIQISPLLALRGGRSLGAFQISFMYEDRFVAQKVVNDLMGRFMDENVRTRADQSVSTTNFLREQYDLVKKELDGAEEKVAAFRARNVGRLPDQLEATMQRVATLEGQKNGLANQISRSTKEKMLLEGQLQQIKAQYARGGDAPAEDVQVAAAAVRAANPRIQQLDRDIENLELALTTMRERYTESHPDVQQVKLRIATVQNTRAALIKQEEAKEEQRAAERQKEKPAERPVRRISSAAAGELRALQASMNHIQAQIQAKDLELQDLQSQYKQLDANIKLASAPIHQGSAGIGEYSILLQDRDAIRRRYDDLNIKLAQSETATELEKRQQGETMDIVDRPSLPETPVAPKRWLIVSVGAVLGLMAGFSVAALREVKDTSIKNLKDARAYTKLAVLASVPLLENDLVVRRRRRLTWLAWSTACLFGIAVMAGSVVYYYSTKA